MEQKKTLWIIAASGVFLLVVIGAAMILYSPSSKKGPSAATVSAIQQPADMHTVQQQPPVSSDLPIPAGNKAADEKDSNSHVNEMTVISGTTNVYGINTNTSGTAAGTGTTETDGTTTIDLNTLKTASSGSSASVQQEAAPVPATVQVQKKPESEASVRTIAPASKGTAVKAETAVKNTYKKAEPGSSAKPTVKKAVPVPKYWVQAASFASKKIADDARAILDQNRIPSEVFTYKDSKNKTFYRVRIGPYTTRSEAEYWRTRIIQINEFKDTQSYITDSSAPAK
jgi:cell division protein FtsN